MNILCLGGTGMLGRNIQLEFKKRNIEGVFVGREEFDKYNLLDHYRVNRLFYDTKPDVVIHAAANCGGIGYNQSNPGILIKDNLQIGINVLDACREHNVKNVYYVSTCCSYPKHCPVPFKEEDLWKNREEETNRAYGVAKKTIIVMAEAYRQQFGLKTTTFILANLYGMYDSFDPRKSHVVPALIKKFLEAIENNKSEVKCFGSGLASRDLLFSGDASQAITDAITRNFDHSEPINLGTGKDISIKDLAMLIAKLTGYKGDILFTGEISDGQPIRRLDTNKARELLGWTAETSLEKGLQETIQWYKENK